MSDLPPPPPGGGVPPPPPPPGGGYPPPPGDYGTYTPGQGYVPSGQFVPAGFWIRFAAAFVDGLILAIPSTIVSLALVDNGGVTFGPGGDLRTFHPLASLINLAIAVAYFALQEGGPTGQTIGKKVCGIRVIDVATGGSIGNGRAAGRYFGSLVSGYVCLLGYLWMLWDDKKQTWHDKMVGSNVVKV